MTVVCFYNTITNAILGRYYMYFGKGSLLNEPDDNNIMGLEYLGFSAKELT